eukprot:NODE_505_length_912_cov_2.815759_g386_i0.p8 GENE.NODE_505_length_912_cov_2.815759_g386_i0~~NODE_505_length_912_cov_2.815759_g386_i0.p8  ORF type:complete len:53 (-),score=8.04 NODE_505_length_912_cov_2.815759_g386_i0:645-803(-)
MANRGSTVAPWRDMEPQLATKRKVPSSLKCNVGVILRHPYHPFFAYVLNAVQ